MGLERWNLHQTWQCKGWRDARPIKHAGVPGGIIGRFRKESDIKRRIEEI